jgi:peptidyl-prolyl cis-trans isomerase A (cyclophilin A)
MTKTQKLLPLYYLVLASMAIFSLFLVGCAGEPEPAEPPAKEEAAPPPETKAPEPPKPEPEPEPAKPKPTATSLMNPSALKERAPDMFQVKFETSKGDVLIDVTRSWAPKGADRFYNLVKNGFYDECKFFRVVPNFIVQIGMHPDPKVSRVWQNARITDDPVTKTNRKGTVVFANAGPNTRTTQIFINYKANAFLDNQAFAPFGAVTEGMDIVEGLYAGYGEAPEQGMIRAQGNKYLESKFPKLDFIKQATIIE